MWGGAGTIGAVVFARSPKPTTPTPTPAARTCQPPHPCHRSLCDRTFGQFHQHPLRHTRCHNRAMHTDGLKKIFKGATVPTLPPPPRHTLPPPQQPSHPHRRPAPPYSSDRTYGQSPRTRTRPDTTAPGEQTAAPVHPIAPPENS